MTDESVKSVIVTGASGGIGRVVAARLARDGFAVAVNYAGNAAKADEVVAEVKATGGHAVALPGDVSNPTDVARLFGAAIETFGRLDAVVHCAGIMPMFPIAASEVEKFDQVIAINLRGTFLVMANAAEHLTSGGRIIAFSSSVLAKSFPGYGAYVASKGGVEALMRVLANELRGRNITVNVVAPGPIPTDLFLKGKSEERINEFIKMSPLERLGQPEDVAATVSFLAGPDGGWVNAQVLRVNGGFA